MNFNTNVGSPEIHDPRFQGGSTPIGGGGGPMPMGAMPPSYGPPMTYAQQMQQGMMGTSSMGGGMGGNPGGNSPPFPHHMFPLPSSVGGGSDFPPSGPVPENFDMYTAQQGPMVPEYFSPQEFQQNYPMPPPSSPPVVNSHRTSSSSAFKTIKYSNLWQIGFILVALIVLFYNSFLLGLQRYITPTLLRTSGSGNPPIAVVIFNAVIVVIIFCLVLRYSNV